MIRFVATNNKKYHSSMTHQKTVIAGVSVGTLLCRYSGSNNNNNNSNNNNNNNNNTRSHSKSSIRKFHSTKTTCEPRKVTTKANQSINHTILPSRSEQVSNLSSSQEFDVLIVGGGATGCGAALDATTRGLSTALIEKGDFGNETSARSTKLLWVSSLYHKYI